MIRHCNGKDPNLIKRLMGRDVPCRCGAIFDDEFWTVVYPHRQVHGALTLMPEEGSIDLRQVAHLPYVMEFHWQRNLKPDIAWKWLKWTFGFWIDPKNHTIFGIDFGPLEIVWHSEGYRP